MTASYFPLRLSLQKFVPLFETCKSEKNKLREVDTAKPFNPVRPREGEDGSLLRFTRPAPVNCGDRSVFSSLYEAQKIINSPNPSPMVHLHFVGVFFFRGCCLFFS